MTRKPFRLAAAAVSGLAISTLAFGAPAAFADTNDQTKVDGVSQAATNPSLVNPGATVQLNIQKHLGATTGQPNNGTVQTIDRPKLQGVNFDVYQVQYLDGTTWKNVDLTTNAGWDAAAAVEGAMPAADGTFTVGGVQYKTVFVETVTTDTNGIATFTKANGVGLYFVKENLATSTSVTVVGSGEAVNTSSITPSAPFFVTLPMTNPTDLNSWMYDVRVYPKNQTDSITKTVDDKVTYTVDKPISYTLNSTISPIEKLGYYYLADNNPYVSVTSVSLSIKGDNTNTALVGCDGTANGTGSCDYFYWLDSDATEDGSQLEIAFTQAGLNKLQTAKAADTTAQVVTTINGTVASVPEAGVVPNQGSFIPSSDWYYNNGGDPTKPVTPPTDEPNKPTEPQNPEVPGIPSNEVKSYFGNITVDKKLTGGADSDSAVGATFAVYVDPTPTTECTTADVSAPNTALMTESITEGNTVTFAPLRASNWANNAALTAASDTNGWIQYCVVETKAPSGYNLNAEPFAATINWATGTTTLTRTATVEITDEKTNLGNQLPLTGGEGIAALSIGGLALVGGGAAYYAVASRKRREA
jgi:LPXTG-motif cell wall-anchored protein